MENTQYEKRLQYDDEISLVDIVSTFLKRRRVFYVVFLAIMLAGIGYAVVTPEKYSYVSLVKLAESGSGAYIDKPAVVIASLENRWVPEFEAAYIAEHDKNLPFKIVFENPENTGLVRINSEASPAAQEVVQQFHHQLLSQLEKRQSASVSQLKQRLERRLKGLGSTIDMLKGLPEAGEALAAAIERRVSTETALESIEPMDILVVSRQSAGSKGPAKSLIIVLTVLLGMIVGVFTAFFAEFIGAVKSHMSEL